MSWGHYSVFQQVGSTFLPSNNPKGPSKVEKPVGFDGFEKKATIWLKSVHSALVSIYYRHVPIFKGQDLYIMEVILYVGNPLLGQRQLTA